MKNLINLDQDYLKNSNQDPDIPLDIEWDKIILSQSKKTQDSMILQECLFTDYSIHHFKIKWIIMVSNNGSNIHGFSNVMMKLEMDYLVMLISGKELEMMYPQSH